MGCLEKVEDNLLLRKGKKMTDMDTGSLTKETGIRNTLKRYLGPDGVIMILLVLLAVVGIGDLVDRVPLHDPLGR